MWARSHKPINRAGDCSKQSQTKSKQSSLTFNAMTERTYWVISINPDLSGNIMTFGSYPDAWNYWRNMNLTPNGMMYMLIENPDVAEQFCNEHNLQFTNYITQES
jgi:hypothetical protein